MANPEHLKTLKYGITNWNRWRRTHLHKTPPDLSGADLRKADLREIDLRGVNLSKADLRGANLSEADLTKANLSNVDLKEANLSNADFSNADLTETYLNRSNLSEADFRGANLSGANLNKVCIENWKINAETNLKNIKCDYIFRKLGTTPGFEYRFEQRYPQQEDEIFEPGEFEKLVRKAQKTIDLSFPEGIDWQALSNAYEQLKISSEAGEYLPITAIENQEDGSVIVRIQAAPEIDQAEFKRCLEARYKIELKSRQLKQKQALEIKNTEIDSHQQEQENIIEITELLAKKPINVEAKATINYDESKEQANLNSGEEQVDRIAANENNPFIQADSDEVNSNPLRDNATQQANSTPEQQISISDILGIDIPEVLASVPKFILTWQFLTIAISSFLLLFVWFHQTYFDTSETEEPQQNQPESQFQ
ncbi:MAG: pentapeptide repeat-containing protein [Microcoleaceae cyanobacterium]